MESIKDKNTKWSKNETTAGVETQKDMREPVLVVGSVEQKNFGGHRNLRRMTALFLLAATVLGATFIQAKLAGNGESNESIAKLAATPTNTPRTLYVTSDSLGSPRIITDEAGNVVSRRDFLPFGEEIPTGTGGRTAAQGYGATDNIRQKFTGYERDAESGLDFAQARFYNYNLGRFTSPDPLLSSGRANNPQTWNRFAYVGNNPLNITDPFGLDWYYNRGENKYKWYADGATIDSGFDRVVGSSGQNGSFVYQSAGGAWITLNPNANNWQSFETQADATKRFGGLYNCNNCQELANSVAEQSETKGKIVGGVALTGVAIGTGVGAGMVLTGTAAGTGITTLGLTQAGAGTATTVATAAAANPEKTAQVIQTTIHGGQRIAGELATRGGVLSPTEVQSVTSLGRTMTQADGAIVKIQQVGSRFNVVVQGDRGIITTFKNLSQKSLDRLGKNYGWK